MQLSLIYGGGADVLQLHPQFRATREWQKKKMLSVKGGGRGTPYIRNLFFGPKTGVFGQKNNIYSPF